MKSLLLFSLTILLAACSTTNTNMNTSAETADINESYTLEQIATKSQTLNSDIRSDLDLLIPESVNNSFRANGKNNTKTQISTNEINSTTTTTK